MCAEDTPFFWEGLCSNSTDTRIWLFQMKLQKDFLLMKFEMGESVPLISHPRQYHGQSAGAMAVELQIYKPPKILFAA